jgi:hypothetical protein
VHSHSAARRACVAHHVGDRVLHDAVRAYADPDGNVALLAAPSSVQSGTTATADG